MIEKGCAEMVAPSEGKLLYHLTHIDNIGSIVTHGLMPRARMRELPFKDIADPEIILKREARSGLSQYIPFHFFVKMPFDCAVCANHEFGEMIIVAVWRATRSAIAASRAISR